MDIFIGLDAGTSNLSAVAVESGGELLATVSRAAGADVDGLPPGRREQSPTVIFDLCVALLAEIACKLGNRAGDVRGIGLTGQMHGILLADEALLPLTNLVTWQDGRGGEPCGDGRTVLEELCRRVGESVLSQAGSRPASGYAGTTLFWHAAGPGLPRGARWALLVHDWLAARLSGAAPVTDPTDAASTGLYNIRDGRWDERICKPLDIGLDLLPPIREAGALLASLSTEVAAATSLPREATVHVALGDNQAGVLASLKEPEREVLLNVGTGGQTSAVTGRMLDAPSVEMRPFPGGRLLAVGASLCGGAALRYLAEHYVLAMRDLAGRQVDVAEALDGLARLAGAVPRGADGLRVAPLFMGTRAQPGLCGSMQGMSADNNTPGHWARAVTEGLVAELAGYYEDMVAAGLEPRGRVVGSGNGMRLNPVLRRAAQEALGMPLTVPLWQEEAACGAALTAMVGAGVFDSFSDLSSLVRYAD